LKVKAFIMPFVPNQAGQSGGAALFETAADRVPLACMISKEHCESLATRGRTCDAPTPPGAEEQAGVDHPEDLQTRPAGRRGEPELREGIALIRHRH